MEINLKSILLERKSFCIFGNFFSQSFGEDDQNPWIESLWIRILKLIFQQGLL